MTEIRLKSLPDTDDYWQYQFDDMVFRTESLSKSDHQRIIPLGQASGILMAYMARHRHLLQGKRVIEPFAGSGPLGLLALHLGAESAHFVDLNPRVSDFIHHNAVENGIPVFARGCCGEFNLTRERHSSHNSAMSAAAHSHRVR